MNGNGVGNVFAPVACCKTLPTSASERSTCAGNGALPSDSVSNLNTVSSFLNLDPANTESD